MATAGAGSVWWTAGHFLSLSEVQSLLTRDNTDLTFAIPSTRQGQSMLDLLIITITRTRRHQLTKDLLKNYLEPEDLCGDDQYQYDK